MNRLKASDKKTVRLSISNVVAMLMFTTLVGQVLGFLKTKLVNANFPIAGPHSTDAYFAAFNVPDFFYFTLSAGALGVALIPVLTDRYNKAGVKGVWEISISLLNLLAVVMFVVGVVILVYAKWLIHHIVAPGLTPVETNT